MIWADPSWLDPGAPARYVIGSLLTLLTLYSAWAYVRRFED